MLTLTRSLTLSLALAASPLATLAKDATVGMDQRVFEIMTEAQTAIEEKQPELARTQLRDLLDRKLSDYERAHTLNLLAYLEYDDGRLDAATELYREAMALEDLPPSMLMRLLVSVGQISLAGERYVDAEKYLRELLAYPEQDTAQHRIYLAAALIGQKRHAAALPELEQAISAERAAGRQPREQWLGMLASVHYEMNNYAAMRDVMMELVQLYPREQYLMNLAALHGQLGDSDRQLALIESMMDDGRLSRPAHLRMLANLFLAHDLPYRAAELLQREIDGGVIEANRNNLELLSQAWYMAAETRRAIPALERAAELSDDGELYLRLARLQMELQEWEAAERAGEQALAKGELREEGSAWLLRGMALVRLEQFREAGTVFKRAARFEHSGDYAAQWLAYIERETESREALAAARAGS